MYNCWGLYHISIFFYVGLRLAFNFIIIMSASRRLPEFLGYKGRRYPGQQSPNRPTLQPRRMILPPTFAQDQEWKKIGAKRMKFLHLGLPRFGEPKKITVKPVNNVKETTSRRHTFSFNLL